MTCLGIDMMDGCCVRCFVMRVFGMGTFLSICLFDLFFFPGIKDL